MSFIKKFIRGKVLEVGAGCGSLQEIINEKINVTLTETDKKIF